MSYYHLPTSTERGPGQLETKLSDGKPLGPPASGWTPELAALVGFVPVVDVARPADTPTHTTDRSLSVNGNVVTVVWTSRPKTVDELASDTRSTNTTSLRDKTLAAIAGNLTALADVTAGHTALATATTNSNAIIAAAGASIAAVNTKVNNLAAELKRVINVVDAMLTQDDRALRQLTAIERLSLGGTALDVQTGT